MDERFEQIDRRFVALEATLHAEIGALEHRMLRRFDELEQRVKGVQTRLESLEQRVEAVEYRLASLEKRFDAVEKRLGVSSNTPARRIPRATALVVAEVTTSLGRNR